LIKGETLYVGESENINLNFLGEYLVSPSYLLTTELEESTLCFEQLLSEEAMMVSFDEEVFFFSGDLKVSF
jgi:hypothetical protein